jgi:flagellar biosynthesis chaperone FliJ
MATPRKDSSIETRIEKAEQKVKRLKVQYDSALAQLKTLLDEQDRIRAERILKAIAKSGKSFDEVVRLIEL